MGKRHMMVVWIFGLIATAAYAQPAPANIQQQADSKVRSLLLLMDKDPNGKVSRSKFMAFMSAAFDRMDVNNSGELDINTLTPFTNGPANLRYSSKHTGGTGSR
jgi:hypothetical protein